MSQVHEGGSLLAGYSRQAPKQSYFGRPSSSSGLRSSMPGMRPSVLKGGRIGAPKAPAEVPLGTTHRVRQSLLHASSYMQSAVLNPCPIQIAAEQATTAPHMQTCNTSAWGAISHVCVVLTNPVCWAWQHSGPESNGTFKHFTDDSLPRCMMRREWTGRPSSWRSARWCMCDHRRRPRCPACCPAGRASQAAASWGATTGSLA